MSEVEANPAGNVIRRRRRRLLRASTMGQRQSNSITETNYDQLHAEEEPPFAEEGDFELVPTTNGNSSTKPRNGGGDIFNDPGSRNSSSSEEGGDKQNEDQEEEDDEIVVYHSGDDSDRLLLPSTETKGLPQESFLSVTLQIFFPFLVAGLGMVTAGLVLDLVQHWNVFIEISELFILVPALLGLKGNLEMTLASRLSTHANMGHMDTKEESWSMIISNLALVQCQAIVVGFLASVFAMVVGWIPEGKFDFDHALLLCAASVVTASIASFTLGVVMTVVIVWSRKCHVNPDNVATPIAASLGDLTTLTLLAWIAAILFTDLDRDKWLAPVIISGYLLFIPICVYVAKQNKYTEKVLRSGWTPVLLAMMISSLGGLILDEAVGKFHGIAVFQPVMNGVGGNLVAVQASRISTSLHSQTALGVLPKTESQICVNPCAIFCGSSVHSRTAGILFLMVIPGHLLFTYTISFLEAGHTSPTMVFLGVYLCAALIQVWILLHTAHWMIHLMWKKAIDPDNSAIPYLTALGDLLGGILLWLAFELLFLIGDKDSDVGD